MMCDDCDAVPAQFVAYFNKAGGKLWRPAQKQAPAWAIDIRPPSPLPDGERPGPMALSPGSLRDSISPDRGEGKGEETGRFVCEETRAE